MQQEQAYLTFFWVKNAIIGKTCFSTIEGTFNNSAVQPDSQTFSLRRTRPQTPFKTLSWPGAGTPDPAGNRWNSSKHPFKADSNPRRCRSVWAGKSSQSSPLFFILNYDVDKMCHHDTPAECRELRCLRSLWHQPGFCRTRKKKNRVYLQIGVCALVHTNTYTHTHTKRKRLLKSLQGSTWDKILHHWIIPSIYQG